MLLKQPLSPLEIHLLRELNGEPVPSVGGGSEVAGAFMSLRDMGYIKLVCAEGDCWYVLTEEGNRLMGGRWPSQEKQT